MKLRQAKKIIKNNNYNLFIIKEGICIHIIKYKYSKHTLYEAKKRFIKYRLKINKKIIEKFKKELERSYIDNNIKLQEEQRKYLEKFCEEKLKEKTSFCISEI
ncbi:MAG: hypothetical protein NC222_06730 [Staphylococcus sp.]|nr:hypothetical protein [Staphylococcus sp.]